METRNAQISLAIINHIAQGKHVTEAIDAVLGAGTADRVIGEVYDALRAKYEARVQAANDDTTVN